MSVRPLLIRRGTAVPAALVAGDADIRHATIASITVFGHPKLKQ